MSIAIGSGNITSCIEDLYLWNEALHRNKLLSKKAYLQLIHEHAIDEEKGVAYGYGIFLKHPKFPNHNSLGSFGKINGFLTVALYEPDRDRFTILLSNSENAPLPKLLENISSQLEGFSK